MLSWTYYFLHDQLDKIDPIISMRLRHELQKRELDPFINRTDFWWMAWDESPTVFVNNWNPWCNANALLCYMLLENDRDKLAKAVYKSMISVDRYLNYVKADGACEEGATYWGHAFGKLFDYLQELQMITGGKVSLFNNKLVKDMGEFVAKSYIGNGYAVNFADASAHVSDYMALVYRCGKALGSREMMDMAVDCFKEKPETVTSVWLDTYKQIEAMKVLKEMSQAKGGYKADAVDYLLKPFSLDDFRRAAQRVKKRYELENVMPSVAHTAPIQSENEDDTIFFKTDHRVVRVDINDIRYVVGMAEYLKIHLDGQKSLVVLLSMKKLEERLPAYFLRIHRSYIVNMKKVMEVTKNRIVMDADTYLPVGDIYKESLSTYLADKYLGR